MTQTMIPSGNGLTHPLVGRIRAASRRLVRELDLLGKNAAADCTLAQGHALLELRAGGALSIGELGRRLRLDPSSISRSVSRIERNGWISREPDPEDQRRRLLSLTDRGREAVKDLDLHADSVVQGGLRTLSEEDAEIVARGLALYARALAAGRLADETVIRPVRPADDEAIAAVLAGVRAEIPWDEPPESLLDPGDEAVSALYDRPRSGYWVLEVAGRVEGGGGVLPHADDPEETCVLERVYLRPAVQGAGLGRKIVERCLDGAGSWGYRRCTIETISKLSAACHLYRSLGFRDLDGPYATPAHEHSDVWMQLEL